MNLQHKRYVMAKTVHNVELNLRMESGKGVQTNTVQAAWPVNFKLLSAFFSRIFRCVSEFRIFISTFYTYHFYVLCNFIMYY